MPADIIVRVGAALDRSTDAVFAQIEKRARDMHGANSREGRKALADKAGMSRQELALVKASNAQQLAIERDRYRENSRLNRMTAQEQLKTERALALQSAQIARQRTRDRLSALATEEKAERDYQQRLLRMKISSQREANRAQRTLERQRLRQEYAGAREIDRFATRTSHRATRFFFPRPEGAIGYGKRVAMDFARGAGIDFNLATQTGKIVEQERIARNLSTQGYVQGADGSAGKRVDPLLLQQEARQTAAKYGSTTSDVLMAGKAFVGQRGNLAGFRDLQGELTKRAVATGTSAEDIGLTAAKIDSALASQGEYATNEKMRNAAIIKLLDNFIMQGKVGSVEFENMAKEIPKLSGIAAGFTGDAAKNLSDLLIVTQLAERGPAKNSATASTYTQNFALDLPKRAAAFKDAGINIFDNDGRLRGIQDIVIETLAKTESTKSVRQGKRGPVSQVNQTQQLSALLPNKRSFLALQEFLNVFRGAGGGEAGINAVKAEFTKFGGSNAAQLDEDVAKAMMGVGNQANRFNAQLENVTQRMLNRLVPAFDRAEPAITSMVESFAKVVTWAAENPGKAITAALAASIARAGFESVGRLIIERVIMGFAGGAAGSAAGGVAGGVAGGALRGVMGSAVSGLAGASGLAPVIGTGAAAASVAVGLAALGAATFTLTTALLENANKISQSNQQERAKDTNDKFFEGASAIANAENPLAKFAAYDQAKQKIIKEEEQRTGSSWGAAASMEARAALKSLEEFYVNSVEKPKQEQANAAIIGAKGQLSEAGLTMALSGALVGKTLNVRVTNAEDINMTPANGGAPGGGPPRANTNFWD